MALISIPLPWWSVTSSVGNVSVSPVSLMQNNTRVMAGAYDAAPLIMNDALIEEIVLLTAILIFLSFRSRAFRIAGILVGLLALIALYESTYPPWRPPFLGWQGPVVLACLVIGSLFCFLGLRYNFARRMGFVVVSMSVLNFVSKIGVWTGRFIPYQLWFGNTVEDGILYSWGLSLGFYVGQLPVLLLAATLIIELLPSS